MELTAGCSQVKSGGAIEPQGTRITLRITDPSDMTRDILKVQCPGDLPCPPVAGVGSPGGRSPPCMGLKGCSPLQSETCSVEIPDLEFELGMGALGGKFTTLEGLLKDIRDLVSGPGPAWGAQPPSCPSWCWLGGPGCLTCPSRWRRTPSLWETAPRPAGRGSCRNSLGSCRT